MKSLVTIAALAALVATPALAQTKRTTGQQQTQQQVQQKHSANPRNDVYVNGRYIGSDPDAFIRLQLQNDPGQGGTDSGSSGGE